MKEVQLKKNMPVILDREQSLEFVDVDAYLLNKLKEDLCWNGRTVEYAVDYPTTSISDIDIWEDEEVEYLPDWIKIVEE